MNQMSATREADIQYRLGLVEGMVGRFEKRIRELENRVRELES